MVTLKDLVHGSGKVKNGLCERLYLSTLFHVLLLFIPDQDTGVTKSWQNVEVIYT